MQREVSTKTVRKIYTKENFNVLEIPKTLKNLKMGECIYIKFINGFEFQFYYLFSRWTRKEIWPKDVLPQGVSYRWEYQEYKSKIDFISAASYQIGESIKKEEIKSITLEKQEVVDEIIDDGEEF